VRSNALAVNSINRELKLMKLRLHGKYQTNRQHFDVEKPTQRYSYAIPLDQFDCHRTINKVDSTGTPYVGTVVGTCCFKCDMQTGTTFGALSGNDSKFPLENLDGTEGLINPMWQGNNMSIPDGGQYFCHGASYNVEIEGVADNRYITFRMFSVLPAGFIKSSGFDVLADVNSVQFNQTLMPNCMRFMNDMARPSGATFPKNRFKVYWEKRIYLNSKTHSDGNQTQATTSGRRSFKFNINPNKVVKQHFATPNDVNDPGAASSKTSATTFNNQFPFGPFGPSNRPVFDPLWLMYSTDIPDPKVEGDEGFDPEVIAESVSVRISRTCRWRDNVGGQI
jgi:hypothetical protein